MFSRLTQFLSRGPLIALGGLLLIASFFWDRTGLAQYANPALITVVICGIPIVFRAYMRLTKSVGMARISSPLLITMAMIASLSMGEFFAAGEVAFIMAIGQLLEHKTAARARKGLRKLISLTPTQGRRLSAKDGVEMVPAEQLAVGDCVRILPGETIPADGVIVVGETAVGQSILTGESLPVDKTVGGEVYCGTVNCFGSIDIRVTKVGTDNSLQKLIRLLQEADKKKAPMARIADKAASWLVPTALLVAIVTGLVTGDLTRAVTILVVFCPCSLVLATPTAIMAAIGQATKKGVIIKSGEALEKMGAVDTVAFDKTGTLTTGCLRVSDVILFDASETVESLLALTASAEMRSEHPLGKAIVAQARGKGVQVVEPTAFTMKAGRGVTAQVNGRALVCGNEGMVTSAGVLLTEAERAALADLRAQGKAVVLVAEGSRLLGALALADTVRAETAHVLRRLGALNVKTTLLTGDNARAAQSLGQEVELVDIHAELLPEQKVECIHALQTAGRTVAMVGDGVNDAPSLKTANVGIAMGGLGSDLAIEAADIALIRDDLTQLPYLKRLANATAWTIRFSISLSMTINFFAVLSSMAGYLTPTTGALVHNAGSCFVVLIAALLYDRKFDEPKSKA